jgi:hypothetical protein
MPSRSIILSFLFAVVTISACAQQTLVVLKDSVKLKTDLISTSESQLITKAGVFSLNEVFSVKFLNAEESQKRPIVVEKLLRQGITVYVGDQKLMMFIPPQNENTNDKNTVDQNQSPISDAEWRKLPSIGFGIGIDYGGIGGRFAVPLSKAASAFLSAGYAIAGVGYNAGLRARFSNKPTSLTASIMYGYNSVIKIEGAPQLDKIYTGVSIGLGFQINSRRNQYNSFQAGFILPFRSDEFENDWNSIKRNTNIKTLSDPWPVLITFGYHFSLYQ